MAEAVFARHAGARYTVITDLNPYQARVGEEARASRGQFDCREKKLAAVQKDLGYDNTRGPSHRPP